MTDYPAIMAQWEDLPTPGTGPDLIAECGLSTLTVGADIRDVEACLRQLAMGTGNMDKLGLMVLRQRAIAELAHLEIKGGAGMVDAALARAIGPGAAAPGQGTAIAFPAVEPWPDAVDGGELLASLVRILARYVAMPEGVATVGVLWVLFTHVHDAFGISPILAVTSPEKRCGKSTLLELLSRLVARPLPTSNITAAALFRTVETYSPTLLIDEADTFVRDNQELRGVLNSGHRRASAFVVRTVGDDHEPRQFGTWCPKAIGTIGKLPDTLEDRSLVLTLRRRRTDESVEPMRLDRLAELQPLLRQAVRWGADHLEELRAADPAVPDGLNDRAADNWRPLLAIADAIGGIWPNCARNTAALLLRRGPAEQAPAEQLLADLADLFNSRGVDRLASTAIVEHLAKLEDRPWPEWRNGRAMTETQLAKLLSRFEIRSRTHRFGVEIRRGYERNDFADAFARYVPTEPQQPQQAPPDAALATDSECNTIARVADAPTHATTDQYSLVADVADVADGHGGSDDEAAAAAELSIERGAIQSEGGQ